DARSFVIDSCVAIRFAPHKHTEDGPHQFVGEGDDRLLVAAANDQALVLGAEDGLGSPCGVGSLAQKIANDGIAVAGLTALTLARRLVVAGTQRAPSPTSDLRGRFFGRVAGWGWLTPWNCWSGMVSEPPSGDIVTKMIAVYPCNARRFMTCSVQCTCADRFGP